VGALAVHELRFALAGGAREISAHHGHGYLALLEPLTALLTALVLAHLLVRSASQRPTASLAAVRVRRLWPAASLALLAIHASQELLEAALASRPAGELPGVLASGGWVAIPLALAFGAFVAFGLRAARRVEAGGLARVSSSWMRLVAVAELAWRRPTAVLVPRLGVLASHLAGRGPPVAVV